MPEINEFHIAGLILKTFRAEATPEESSELQEWLDLDAGNRHFYNELNDASHLAQEYWDYKSVDVEAAKQKFWALVGPPVEVPVSTTSPVETTEEINTPRPRKIGFWARVAAAAIVVIIAAVYLYNRPTVKSSTTTVQVENPSVPVPGTNKATLVLADGSRHPLQDKPNGIIYERDGIRCEKSGGKLVYTITGPQQQPITYDSLIVPLGGKFSLVMVDGTEVWLNSASSIRYPANLRSKERSVAMTGESYFEIADDPTRPFIVTVKNASLQALGTKFNVNAYDEKLPVRTSLLEGKLKVTSKSREVVLTENQAALISPTEAIDVVPEDDFLKIIAWKNGEFDFDNDPITTVAYQLARWYNMRVFIEGSPTTLVTYSDSMNRPIDTTLNSLRKNKNIHIYRNGNTIIVKP